MDNLHNDERISAYLDGELSADEQTRFEERLAESAELRQLVEELRALRGSLDLLPRHRLEADFADHVLRRAEREMLTAGDGASGSVPTEGVGHAVRAAGSPSHTPRAAIGESRNWKRRAWRPLIYAAVAVAAAVLIMIFNPPINKDKDIAQVGDNAKPARLPEGAVASSKSGGGPAAPGAAGEAGRPRADDQTKFEDLAQTKDAPAASGGIADFSHENHRRSGGVAEQGKLGGSLAGSPAGSGKHGEENSKASNFAQSLEKTEQEQVKGGLNAGQDMAKTPAGASPNQVARDGDGQGTNLRSKIEAGGVEKTPSSGREFRFETPSSAPVQNAPAATAKGRANGEQNADLVANGGNSTKEVLRRNTAPPAGMVVANCIASSDAAQEVFFGLLAKNGIEMNTMPDGAPTTYSPTFDRFAKKPEEPADKDHLHRTVDKAAEAKRSLGEIEKAKGQTGEVEVIYVEGTVKQIKSLMNDLRAEPKVFRSLTVAPAPTFPIASYAYDGNFANDHRPLDLQLGGYQAAGKPAVEDARLYESLREREAFGATTKRPPVSATAPAGNKLSDHLTSDEKSIEGFGAKLAATDKAMKDQTKQAEPAEPTAGAALADKPSAVAGEPMKPAGNSASNEVSARFRSLAAQPPAGEKAPPLSGRASPTPAGPAAASSVPTAQTVDAVSPSQPPAAPAAPAAVVGGASRTMTHAEADAESIEWGNKQVPARSETAGAKQQPSTPLGHAVRLDSWALDSPPVQLEWPKAGDQMADDAPVIATAPPAGVGSGARGAGASLTDRSPVKKDEGKPSPTNLTLPSIEATGGRTMLRSDPKSSPKEADVEFRAASPRMQAIFVFRLEPAPATAAAVAPPAKPAAAQTPPAGTAAPTAKEKK